MVDPQFRCLLSILHIYTQYTSGLRYVERMGERPEHKLSIRHFNKVVRACCRDPELRSLRSVLRVRMYTCRGVHVRDRCYVES